MYRKNQMLKSTLTSVETYEGETIEEKVERIVDNKEPIKDGAPSIFTERKHGVTPAYNIRTDRWEIATDAMDLISKNHQAKRDERQKLADEKEKGKVINLNGETESTHGENNG